MNKVCLVIVVIVLIACGPQDSPTNEELVKQAKVCTDAGMDANLIRYADSSLAYRIQCEPKKITKEKD